MLRTRLCASPLLALAAPPRRLVARGGRCRTAAVASIPLRSDFFRSAAMSSAATSASATSGQASLSPSPPAATASASASPPPAASGLVPLLSVERHSPRVIRVLGQNPGPMTLQGTNTYLLGTGAHRLLIDAGEGVEAYTQLLRQLIAEERLEQLTILLTHWHGDHTGGLRSVCGLFDAAHQPAIHKFAGAALVPAGVLRAFPGLAERIQTIMDGQQFTVEGATLTALHTPGHTTDHCVFRLDEEQAVLSGDTILGGSSAVFQDLHAYMHSLRRIATVRAQRIYPAHGPIIDGNDAHIYVDQYLHHRTQRETQILAALRDIEQPPQPNKTDQPHQPHPTVLDLVARVYVGLSPNLILAAANNVLLHLDKLLKEGRVRAIEIEAPPSATPAAAEADEEDCCKAEIAKAQAIAQQRASWRWQLVTPQ